MNRYSLNLIVGLLFLSVLLACKPKTSNLEKLDFGSESTFDIISWNIELFPKHRHSTDIVEKVLSALKADVYALQEIKDTSLLKEIVARIPGYKCIFQSNNYSGLVYVYNTNTIKVNSRYELFPSNHYYEDVRRDTFPRKPQVLDFMFNKKNYFIINNHFICCGDGKLNIKEWWDEENRKMQAAIKLKEYIDNHLPEESVILVGDLNDQINDPDSNNVFQDIINDSTNYLFADMEIALKDKLNWSCPQWPAHLDHILITNELFTSFQDTGSEITVIKIDAYLRSWNSYKRRVSDHRPIGLKLNL